MDVEEASNILLSLWIIKRLGRMEKIVKVSHIAKVLVCGANEEIPLTAL
jgi:CRISPR/Cas system-associated protein Cas5 (RAMP superfamily)